jgi:archaellum component FlaC
MKKVVKKITQKANESDIEMLARIVQDGFSRMDGRFTKMEDRMEGKFTQIDNHFEKIEAQITGIHHELKDHTVRLDRIEHKQIGMLVSIDENIHRSEFKNLASRVEALEKKSIKVRH